MTPHLEYVLYCLCCVFVFFFFKVRVKMTVLLENVFSFILFRQRTFTFWVKMWCRPCIFSHAQIKPNPTLLFSSPATRASWISPFGLARCLRQEKQVSLRKIVNMLSHPDVDEWVKWIVFTTARDLKNRILRDLIRSQFYSMFRDLVKLY